MPQAQYVIDIATAMPEGESTIAELDKLTANLMGSGKGAEFFQQAVKQVSASLDAAKAASAAANAALAAGSEEYRTLERAALQSAKAAEKAAQSDKFSADERNALTQKAQQAASAVDGYAAKLKGLEATATDASKKQDALSKSLGNVEKLSRHVDESLTKQAEATGKLKGALAGIGGPLGRLGSAALSPVDAFAKLSTTMGSSSAAALVAAAGVAAAAAAVVAITAVLVAGTIAVASWAIGLSNSNREYALTLQATEVLNPSLSKLHDTIDVLGTQTGLTEQAIDGIAISLKSAHVAARDMPAALQAASLAEAALGNGGASQFIERMQTSGKSVRAFSATVSAQLGGVVAKKLLGLSEQAGQFKQNIGTLFGSLNIEPALTGLQKLVGLFDENTAAGSAIKFLFGSVFQPLINQADNAATVIEAFALGFLIGMVKLYIALKPTIKAVSEFLGFKDTSLADTLALVTKAGEYVVPAFVVAAVILGTFAVAIGATVAAAVAIQVAIYSMIAAVVYAGVKIVEGVIGAWQAVTGYLNGIIPGLGTIGTQIMQGLADGIAAAAGLPLKAITGAVGGAISTARELLDINSPSKVFRSIGGSVGEGFASGIDGGADEVQSSMADMAAPPDVSTLSAQDALSGNAGGSAIAPSAAKPAASSGNAGGGINIDLSGSSLTFTGVKDAPEALERFKEMLTKVYEEDAGSVGGASYEGDFAPA